MRSLFKLVVVLGVSLVAAGCGGCGGSKATLVYGKLVDSTGQPPSAAGQVEVGDTSVDTNESGFFTIEVQSDVETKLRAHVTGYAPTVKTFTAPSESSTFVQVTMLAWDATTTFDAAAQGTISTGGTTITFPANSLDGTGTLTAHLAHLDPSDLGERAAFPGGFVTSDGKLLESFGAVAIVVEDSSGRELQLKSGQTASAQLGVTTTPGDSVPLWYFDEATSRWKQEGSLSNCASGTCTASLPHLSWWNADQVVETSCLKACAKNKAGDPAVGVSLEARGVDYNGSSYGTTGYDGCACLDVRKASQVQIVGVTSGGIIGPVTETTASSTMTCSGGGCPSLTTPLTIETPKFQAILTWKENPSDLDSHFTGPCEAGSNGCTDGRFHIYYSARGSLTESPFAYLDTDDTTGFGPEITTLTACKAGVYRFSVHLYSGTPGLEASAAKVALLLTDGSLVERTVPTANPNTSVVWTVGDLDCNASCACSWKAVDTFVDANDTTPYDP
ncbi:MAG: hypothetical protein IT380_30610 [Myxococcales bacterium]|nr:hypothetical protein [Myxococcales bacterium]